MRPDVKSPIYLFDSIGGSPRSRNELTGHSPALRASVAELVRGLQRGH